MQVRKYKVRLTFTEPILGSQPQRDVAEEFLSKKAPEGEIPSDEAASLPEAIEKGTTAFHRDPKTGMPCLWNYQIKGFLKDAANAINGINGIAGLKARVTDSLFVHPRMIVCQSDDELTYNDRPLRAMTAQGPRVALARSEQLGAGTVLEFELHIMPSFKLKSAADKTKKAKPAYLFTDDLLREILDRGAYKGIGQWNNGGWGTFEYTLELLELGFED